MDEGLVDIPQVGRLLWRQIQKITPFRLFTFVHPVDALSFLGIAETEYQIKARIDLFIYKFLQV